MEAIQHDQSGSTATLPKQPKQPKRPPRDPVEYVVLQRRQVEEPEMGASLDTRPTYVELGRAKGKTKREAIEAVVLAEDGTCRYEGPFHAVTARILDATENPRVETNTRLRW